MKKKLALRDARKKLKSEIKKLEKLANKDVHSKGRK